jgi:cytoskeletal protein CcmA (bactofilin family)
MRTESWKRNPVALLALTAALGLLTAAPAAAQSAEQEETVVAPAAQAADAEADPASEGARVHVELGREGDRVSILGGSRTIDEGESVRDVLVVGGSLRVRGEVRGDAVVVGGNLTLYETGRIRGDVVVAGGRFRNEGGSVEGEVRSVDRIAAAGAAAGTREVTERRSDRGGSSIGRIVRGFAGIVSTLALAVVLAAVGAVLVFYGFRYLDTVSDTLRASPLRAGGVGLAASFLIIPAFVVLVVALAVSIVGIPILLLAIPLYPLAIAAAMIYGLIAAAYAIGERTSEQRRFELRHRNAYAYLATGLVILFSPVIMGNLVGMTPFLGWLGSLIKFFAFAVIWVATVVGFGAVLLSRAGTRRTFARTPHSERILDEDPYLEHSEV